MTYNNPWRLKSDIEETSKIQSLPVPYYSKTIMAEYIYIYITFLMDSYGKSPMAVFQFTVILWGENYD